VVVWTSLDDVARFKAHNPELIVYQSLPLTHARVNASLASLGGIEEVAFLLMSADDPDAELDDGKPATWASLTDAAGMEGKTCR
jgi:hypothetical protein